MDFHTASENKLFSSTSHSLFTPHYENEVQQLFPHLQMLEASFKKYQSIPLRRRQERLKQSLVLFRAYWQNTLKTLLPYTRESEINSQRLFMRYGLLHLGDISEDDLQSLSMVALHTEQQSFVYYIDEWFHAITWGRIAPLLREGVHSQERNKEPLPGRKKEQLRGTLYLIREATALEGIVNKLFAQSKSPANPFLHRHDLSRPILQQVASREAVQKVIGLVKRVDPQLFTRKLLKELVDLEPYVILVPGYANFGGCWEAFDRLERTESRGRIVVPLYAPDTQRAVLVALANYRWETAKLAAGGYWLEKGLTGGFYDLYRKFSLPGRNEQQAFVAAYCQWILDESRGQIRFNPELRRFFWKEMPFAPQRSELLVKYFGQFRDLAGH